MAKNQISQQMSSINNNEIDEIKIDFLKLLEKEE